MNIDIKSVETENRICLVKGFKQPYNTYLKPNMPAVNRDPLFMYELISTWYGFDAFVSSGFLVDWSTLVNFRLRFTFSSTADSP